MNSTRIPSGKATKPNEIFSARQAANFLTLNVNNYSRSRCCINNRPYSIVETQSYWLLQKINRGRNTSNTKYDGTRDTHWSKQRRSRWNRRFVLSEKFTRSFLRRNTSKTSPSIFPLSFFLILFLKKYIYGRATTKTGKLSFNLSYLFEGRGNFENEFCT